ncbi:MAG: MATE family efflux transporter [Firmicutes bacterium]|nr:MATE family efflux transporter [Bacillota bacterium]
MEKQPIQLSDHFTYGRHLRFVFPSVCMMIFMSIYSIVDGFFVSNFVGKTPLAAINIMYPILIILGAFGFMLGTGGAALVGKVLGEGDRKKANEYFTFFALVIIGWGIFCVIAAQIGLRPLCILLGAEGQVLQDCLVYGRIIGMVLPCFMLQYFFQTFFVTAEKAVLGFGCVVASGVLNIVLDALFIVVFDWGLAGAASATAMAQLCGGVFPLFYFGRDNTSLLRFTRTKWDGGAMIKACSNGASEMLSCIAASMVTILYNYQLLALAGDDGVAAFSVIMYSCFIFTGFFEGYAVGSSPIISFHYGAKNHGELKNMVRKSFTLEVSAGIIMTAAAFTFAVPLAKIFVGYDAELLQLTIEGMRIYMMSFIFMGVGTFGSAFFTALNNGKVSAAISFVRILIFECGSILILPRFFGMTGVWSSIVVAEVASFMMVIVLVWKYRGKYRY